VRLHYRLDGEPGAPVLVLANSLGTTLELWESNLVSLVERYRVLRYDARGHGRSSVLSGPYRVDDLADDVLVLLDELGLERVAFCGLSIGGAVGLRLGASAPQRIERLVVASSSARFGAAETWLERAHTVRTQGVAAISAAVVGRWFTPAFAEAHPEVRATFLRMLEATPPEGYAATCEALAAWDFRERLGDVAVPTLVVAAEDDPATPFEHAELIASGIPGAELAVVEHAAHLVNVEQPHAFLRHVLSHLPERAGRA
jgi:3-oxoadipate enol-lactonase